MRTESREWDQPDPALKRIVESAAQLDQTHHRFCDACRHRHAPLKPCLANLTGPSGRGCRCTA